MRSIKSIAYDVVGNSAYVSARDLRRLARAYLVEVEQRQGECRGGDLKVSFNAWTEREDLDASRKRQ